MTQTISKHIGEGFGRGELYAALAYDTSDAFAGMKIKSIMHDTTYREYFRDSGLYIYSSTDGQLDIVADTTLKLTATTITFDGIANFDLDSIIIGATAGNYGRISTKTAAGSSITLDASYAYGESIELRYAISNWTGIGSSYKALYLRSEATLGGSYGLRGAEFYGVMNTSTTTGLSSLQVLYAEMLVKASASNRTITNGHCIEANISLENQTGTLTLTNNIYCLYAKAQTGTGVNDYTKVNGIKIAGRDDGTARVFGIALDISDPEATVCTWTTGINIATSCATGISIGGTYDHGIRFTEDPTAGDVTNSFINIGDYTTAIAVAPTTANMFGVMHNVTVSTNVAYWYQAYYTKITTSGTTTSTSIAGHALRINIASNIEAAYGIQCHTNITAGADVTQEVISVSAMVDLGTGATTSDRVCALQAMITGSGTAGTVVGDAIVAYLVNAGTVVTTDAICKIMNQSAATATIGLHIDNDGTITDIMKVDGSATYLFNLDDASTFITSGGTDCIASGATDPAYTIKIKDPAGAAGYIRVWAAA